MKKVFTILARGQDRQDIYAVLLDVAASVESKIAEDVRLYRSEDLRKRGESLQDHISTSDVVIADISGSPVDVMYELGFAQGQGRPTILISDAACAPTLFDLQGVYKLLFDRPRVAQTLRHTLVSQIIDALNHPEAFQISAVTREDKDKGPTVFVSYNHVDDDSLNRLRIHLRPIQRESLIEYWDDTQIKAGDRWRDEIERALARTRIAILLISADFLASDFIMYNELPPLLNAAKERGTTILPVILKPCRFSRDPYLSKFQAINDPRAPLISLSEAEREGVYATIAERIEKELDTHSLANH